MSLKELTKDKHTAAEHTPFMQAVFKRTMPVDVWADYTLNKMHWYNAIELRARAAGLLEDLPGLERSYLLYQDYRSMCKVPNHFYTVGTMQYYTYIMDLVNADDIMAHLYVWHMGDLYGGQMIKKIMDQVPHRNLDFDNADLLKTNIRAKIHDGMAKEANCAFDWAIKIMNEYTEALASGHMARG